MLLDWGCSQYLHLNSKLRLYDSVSVTVSIFSLPEFFGLVYFYGLRRRPSSQWNRIVRCRTSYWEVLTANVCIFVNIFNSKMFPINRFNPLQSFPQSSFRFWDWPKGHMFHVLLVFLPGVSLSTPPPPHAHRFNILLLWRVCIFIASLCRVLLKPLKVRLIGRPTIVTHPWSYIALVIILF